MGRNRGQLGIATPVQLLRMTGPRRRNFGRHVIGETPRGALVPATRRHPELRRADNRRRNKAARKARKARKAAR